MTAPPDAVIWAAVGAGRASPCQKSKRGVALWWPGGPVQAVIGHNRPALGVCDGSEACRRDCAKICIHAEQAALLAAVANGGARGAELVHIKVVDGQPVGGKGTCCVECSKLILAAGVAGVWLLEDVPAGPTAWVRYTPVRFQIATLRALGLHFTPERLIPWCWSCGGIDVPPDEVQGERHVRGVCDGGMIRWDRAHQ